MRGRIDAIPIPHDGDRSLVPERGLALLARQLVDEAGCRPDDVVAAACAGNPTMLHAWAGVEIASLGTAPYAGAWARAQVTSNLDKESAEPAG